MKRSKSALAIANHIPLTNLITVLFMIMSFVLFLNAKSNSAFVGALRIKIVDSLAPVVATISRPIHATVTYKDHIVNLFHTFEYNKTLKKENEHLRRSLMAAMQIEAENTHLKKLLHFVSKQKYQYVSARVIGDTSGPFIRSALINVGTKDGVAADQAVVSENGLVGRIIEVGEHHARILLITDMNSRIPSISSSSRERAIIAGNNTELARLRFLPEDTQIRIGEVMLTSGDGHYFLPGIPIGTVQHISRNEITLKPQVEWNRLEYVSVIQLVPSEGAEGR